MRRVRERIRARFQVGIARKVIQRRSHRKWRWWWEREKMGKSEKREKCWGPQGEKSGTDRIYLIYPGRGASTPINIFTSHGSITTLVVVRKNTCVDYI